MIMGDREFVFHGDRFYSVLGGGPDSPFVGVWELRRVAGELREVPPEGQRVRIGSPGADSPSDVPGKTWQERAVAAELEAANQRVELEERARSLEWATGRENNVSERLTAERVERVAMQRAHRDELFRLCELAATVYQREGDWARLDTGDPVGMDDDHQDVYPPTIAQMVHFMGETLAGTHPSVVLPAPGPEAIEAATAAGRAVLATEPEATLAQMMTAGIRAATARAR